MKERYHRYKDVREWKAQAARKGVHVPDEVCREVERFMKKYELTFAESCEILLSRRVLIPEDWKRMQERP